MLTNETGGAVIQARLHSYRLFALIFRREPSDADIETFRAAGFFDLLADHGGPTHARALSASELAVEFARLFLGPGEHISPHESVHRNDPGNGQLWGAATGQVRAFVERLGLSYRDSFGELPDHISAELEIMAQLVEAQAQALDAEDEAKRDHALAAQKWFFGEHLGRWGATFLKKVQAASSEAFYGATASIAIDFLEMEAELLLEDEQSA